MTRYPPSTNNLLSLRSPIARRGKLLLASWLALQAISTASAACRVEQVGTAELTKERGQFELPVVINGAPAISFVVDTGAEKSAIDVSLAKQLALPANGRRRRLTGSDGVKGRLHADVMASHLSLAGVARVEFPLAVADLLIPDKPSVRGVIGADLLANYDVEFDFPGKRLNLYQVRNCGRGSPEFKPSWTQPYEAVPLKAGSRNLLSLPVSINGKVLELLFDTGAVRTKLTLDVAASLGVDLDRMKAEAPRSASYGISGVEKASYSQHFDKIEIGKAAYRNVELKVSDIVVKPYAGLLGQDFLRTRKVWVSYATRQLLVERERAAKPRLQSRPKRKVGLLPR